MKTALIILFCFSCSIFAQSETTTIIDSLTIDSLYKANEQLMVEIDSLNKRIEFLELEIERSKWSQIKDGLTIDEVIRIMGDPDKYEEADFGYKKLIYGEGYSGYILLDRELKVVDCTAPLYLRMKSDLITK